MLGAAEVVVYLGLGSNQGDRVRHLREALEDLAGHGVRPVRASRVYAGPYLGPCAGPDAPQPEYLNAVLEARTRLLPLEVLGVARAVEARHGRPPLSHLRPRTLDVDILLYGGWCIRHAELVVPHPRLGERRFVVEPLCELGVTAAPQLPELGACLAALRLRQPLTALAVPLVPEEDRGAPA